MVFAFAISTAIVAVGGWSTVALVSSISEIPSSLPSFEVPELELASRSRPCPPWRWRSSVSFRAPA